MPAPPPTALSDTTCLNFIQKDIKLPIDWQDMGSQFPQAFAPVELSVDGNPVDNLFFEPTHNRYHVDTARTLGRGIEKYIERICTAISNAISKWMHLAQVCSLEINGPIGVLLPGGVTGPLLEPLILSLAPRKTEMERAYSNAIAKAVSNAWESWQNGLCGILEYPLFIALPTSPLAPPTPNLPAPLITLGSAGEAKLAPSALRSAMAKGFGEFGQHANEIFDALSAAIFHHFQVFKTTTLVTGVIGTGPVPAIPTGPVVGGSVIPSPGNFV